MDLDYDFGEIFFVGNLRGGKYDQDFEQKVLFKVWKMYFLVRFEVYSVIQILIRIKSKF